MARLSESLIASHEQLARDGVPIAEACRRIGPSSRTYYRWAKLGEDGANGLHRDFYERVILRRGRGGASAAELTPVRPDEDWRSVGRFEEWASSLVLDSGERWPVETFQLDFASDVLSGQYQAVWLLVAEGNSKTTTAAGVALYFLDNQTSAEIPIGAASIEQANVLYRQAEGFVHRTPGMLERFKLVPGMRRIDSKVTRGTLRVYPADDRTADGVIPSISFLDELHRQRDLRLYRTWRGKWSKRHGPVIVLSTAGDPASEFETTRAKILREAEKLERSGAHVRAEQGGLVLHDWAIRDRADAEDMEAVAAANPLARITAVTLAEKHAAPEMIPEHWLRFSCNVAARLSGEAIKPEQWDSLREDGLQPAPGAWAVGWIDFGWRIDCTALGVLVWESHERRVIAGVHILAPPVDEADIVAAMVEVQRKLEPVGWAFDPNAGGQQMIQMLDKGTHPGQEGVSFGEFYFHPQDNAAMATAAARLDEAIRNGWIRHDGHAGLRTHALNVVRKPLGGERWRYDRPPDAKGEKRRQFATDALIGVAMGHSVAVSERAEPEPSRAVKHTDLRAERGLKPGEGRGQWVAGEWSTEDRHIDAENRQSGRGSDSARGR